MVEPAVDVMMTSEDSANAKEDLLLH